MLQIRLVLCSHSRRSEGTCLLDLWRALVEGRALGVAVAQLKEAIWGCRRLLREWECHLCVIGASFCHSFLPFLCKESCGPFSLATCDPGWRAAADWHQMSWGLLRGALLAIRPDDRELVPPSAGRFGFACPISEGEKAAALCS